MTGCDPKILPTLADFFTLPADSRGSGCPAQDRVAYSRWEAGDASQGSRGSEI